MSFAFPDIDPNTRGSVQSVDVPLGRYLSASFGMGQHDSILSALNRIGEVGLADMDGDSPILDAETANKRWAVGNLKFEEPVRESVARIMNRRKREEMDREFFLTHGASASRFVPGLAAGIIGSVSNPLDIMALFIPFVGEEAVAAKAGSTFGRVMARRLITKEALKETFPRAPKLAESIINATLGQTLFEVPVVAAASQDQANYGIQNSLMNIAAGGTLGAAIHGAGVLLQKLSNGTRIEMARQAFTQALKDENVNVHRYVQVDEIAIWEKVRFDEQAAMGRAYEAVNIDDIAEKVLKKYGERVSSPAVRLGDQIVHAESHAAAWQILKDEGKVTTKDFNDYGQSMVGDEGFVTVSGKFISREEAGKLMGLPDIGYNHIMWANDRILEANPKFADPTELGVIESQRFNELMSEGKSQTEAFKVLLAERKARRDRVLMSQPGIHDKIEAERVAAINRLVEEERALHEKKKQGLFDALKKQEIDRQIAEGKILAEEEIAQNRPPEKFEEADEGAIDEDIAALKKEAAADEKVRKEEAEAKAKAEEAKAEEPTTAEQIKSAFEGMARGAGTAFREQMIADIKAGKEVTFRKPRSIELVRKDPTLTLRDNPDGSVTVIGVKEVEPKGEIKFKEFPPVKWTEAGTEVPTPQEKTRAEAMIERLDKHIEDLSKPSTKSFTGVFGVEPLIGLVGKEMAKGLLIAFRQGLKLYVDVARAMDHAMQWWREQQGGLGDAKEIESEFKQTYSRSARQRYLRDEIDSMLDDPELNKLLDARWAKNREVVRKRAVEHLAATAESKSMHPEYRMVTELRSKDPIEGARAFLQYSINRAKEGVEKEKASKFAGREEVSYWQRALNRAEKQLANFNDSYIVGGRKVRADWLSKLVQGRYRNDAIKEYIRINHPTVYELGESLSHKIKPDPLVPGSHLTSTGRYGSTHYPREPFEHRIEFIYDKLRKIGFDHPEDVVGREVPWQSEWTPEDPRRVSRLDGGDWGAAYREDVYMTDPDLGAFIDKELNYKPKEGEAFGGDDFARVQEELERSVIPLAEQSMSPETFKPRFDVIDAAVDCALRRIV